MNSSERLPGPSAVTRRTRWKWGLAFAGILVVAIVVARSWGRLPDTVGTGGHAVPVVSVAKVDREDLYKEISVPAEFRPYTEVDVHAKVSGYVQRMNVDIGDRVTSGQLLAVLEIPELKDELDHAVAARQRAEADFKDVHLAYTRLIAVNKQHPNLIAQQDLDTAESKDATAQGALAGTKSDVERYKTLFGYTRITAPFGGVITKRYADPGSLIQAGTTSQTQAMPLVRVSDNAHLRLDFPVSVDYIHDVRIDAPVSVRVDSLDGRILTGKIARITGKVDDSTRTMTAEMEVDNHALDLVPGMYATVILKVETHPNSLAIPVEALAAGGKGVLLVDAAHRVVERNVTLGLETPGKYEVRSGLREGDLVMIGNPEMLVPGQQVVPHIIAPDALH